LIQVITALIGNLDADLVTGILDVTTGAVASGLSIATGSGSNTIHAQALTNDQVLTLTGDDDATVTLNAGDLSATGYTGDVTVTGGASANAITTGDGDDTIIGFAGADKVDGGGGTTDTIVLAETSGDLNTAVEANIANVEVVSAATAGSGVIINLSNQSDGFKIIGSANADTITGSSGADIIVTGGGADVVTGGAGNDTFVFSAGQANGATVTDFTGNAGAAGDLFEFHGFGTVGATFTFLGSDQWQIHSGLDGHDEIIILTGSTLATVHATDYAFVP
jgi:Ca2+-binding RTX toxin-like protein